MRCPIKKKKEEKPHCSVVIVAAGSSQRMGADKIMMKLGAMPVLARTILAFENNEYVDEIILVTKTERLLLQWRSRSRLPDILEQVERPAR